VDDLCWDQVVRAPVTQINDGRSRLDIEVLQQVSRLFNLFGQAVSYEGLARRVRGGRTMLKNLVFEIDGGRWGKC